MKDDGNIECDKEAYHQTPADNHARNMVWSANGI